MHLTEELFPVVFDDGPQGIRKEDARSAVCGCRMTQAQAATEKVMARGKAADRPDGSRPTRLHGAAIEDYALIGDCETAALVSREGSIDWLCWPTFSSPACFAALLGTRDHGFWKIAPTGKVKREPAPVREGTLIVETFFATARRRGVRDGFYASAAAALATGADGAGRARQRADADGPGGSI